MKDLMLDIETLGTKYGSIITQIGACYFNRFTGEIGEELSLNIDMLDGAREGFKMDVGAVAFWFYQPNKSFLEKTIQMRSAFEIYRKFAKKAQCVWSHSTFDFSMIQDACDRLGIEQIHAYRKTKDIRTLMELAGTHKDDDQPEVSREDAHDALADCKHQVGYCVKAFNIILTCHLLAKKRS